MKANRSSTAMASSPATAMASSPATAMESSTSSSTASLTVSSTATENGAKREGQLFIGVNGAKGKKNERVLTKNLNRVYL